jgi:dolichyl-diphosphooligosaccharide--protein glycosyltransferase
MELNAANTTFRYTQRVETGPDGEFTMTVPYSTTGYDEWGTENGYTDVAVEAAGPYQITTNRFISQDGSCMYNTTAEVSEGKVIGEDETPVEVDLTRTNLSSSSPFESQPSDETSGNETSSEGTTGETSDTGSDGATNTSTDGADGEPSLAEPAGDAGIVAP